MSLVQGSMFVPTLGQNSFGGVHEQTYSKQVVTVGCFDPFNSGRMRKKVDHILGLQGGKYVPMSNMDIPGGALSLVRVGKFSQNTVDIEKQWKMIEAAFSVADIREGVLVLSAHTPCLDGCEDAEWHLLDAIKQAKERFPTVMVKGILHHIGGKSEPKTKFSDHRVTVL